MRRLVTISAFVHVGALLALAAWTRAPARPPVTADHRDAIEVDLFAPPPPAISAHTAPPSVPDARLAPPAPTARVAPEPIRVQSPVRLALRAPVPPAPSPPSPLPVAPPVLSPPPAPRPVTPPVLTAASFLYGLHTDVARVGDSIGPTDRSAPPAASPAETQIAQARAASQGFVAEQLAEANPMEPSQVHAYYGALSRRMRETWRPGFYRTPTMVDALLAAPRRMANVAARYHSRAATFALTGRPDDPARPFIPTDFEDRSGFSTRTTSSIVEVEQDEEGRIRSVRIVRSAASRDFDNAALEAVRLAFPQESPMHIPGGRRSRWEFDVVASRDAIVPIAGFMFNESNGFFEMHYPGALHIRTRVRPIGSRPLDVPWPAPLPRAD